MQTSILWSSIFNKSRLLMLLISFLLTISDNYSNSMKDGDLTIGVNALRVQGEFDLSQEFFVFLAKFGFQKTDVREPNNTQGVIFGNITTSSKSLRDSTEFNQNQTKGNDAGNLLLEYYLTFQLQYNEFPIANYF